MANFCLFVPAEAKSSTTKNSLTIRPKVHIKQLHTEQLKNPLILVVLVKDTLVGEIDFFKIFF